MHSHGLSPDIFAPGCCFILRILSHPSHESGPGDKPQDTQTKDRDTINGPGCLVSHLTTKSEPD